MRSKRSRRGRGRRGGGVFLWVAVVAIVSLLYAHPSGAATLPLGAGARQVAVLPPGFQDSVAFSGLTNPTAIRFASDGRVFVAEKSGLIKVFASLSAQTPTVFADLTTNVYNFWDRGLLGLALDPNFPSAPYVYVLYTYDAAIGGTAPRWGTQGVPSDPCPTPPGATTDGCVVSGRLSRLTAAGSVMTGPEQVLINDWCQQFPSHSIGSLAFGADGALYVSAGEGANFDNVDYGQFGNSYPGDLANSCGDPPSEGGALRSQDLRTAADPVGLGGTILRVDPATGAALATNPLIGSTDVNARRIVGSGLRNPFRFTIRPGTSDLWIGDVGWSNWEEIDRLAAPTSTPLNFGWPCYEGNGIQSSYQASNLPICAGLYAQPTAVTAPVFTYAHSTQVVPGESCPAGSSSISGMAFDAPGGSYPAGYDGVLFFADYSRKCIWAMFPGANGLPDPTNIKTFVANAAGPVDLEIGPGGDLFYVDFAGGTIRRVLYSSASASNLALNRPANASSIETNSGFIPSLAVDGDPATRWSSQFSDPQWLSVDLGASYNIGEVRLTWEYAYAKSYRIQVSNDASTWTDVYSTTTGDGAFDDITGLSASGRYVRMYGTVRASTYGYSLWEFEIYAPPPPIVTAINPTSGGSAGGTAVAIAGTGFATATGATTVKFGTGTATAVSCSASTSCVATSPAGSGVVDVTVTVGGFTSTTVAADRFTYSDVPPPTVTAISPTSGATAGGTAVAITGTGFSTAVGATTVTFGAAVASSVSCSSSTNCTAPSPPGSGTVDVTVSVGGLTSATTAADRFTYADAVNRALGRPMMASSIYGAGFEASRAADGDLSTRWSSTFSDPQWIYVDLGGTYSISEVVLRWETAYAAAYKLQVSPDAISWTDIFSTATGDGAVDDLTALAGSGRYVRMSGTARGTPYGYSLWEFEVYSSPAPSIAAISPTAGPPGGGTVVTVTGSGFSSASGSTAFQFGATPATGVTCSSSTSCTVTSPAGSGTVDVRATVGGVTSPAGPADQFTYTSNQPPTPTIATPLATLTWKVGDVIAFSGGATDPEDGTLPASALTWTLTLQHCPSNCHTHFVQRYTGVASGSFVAPDHDYPSYLVLELAATDSGGLTTVTSVQLNPQTVSLTFQSVPTGLQIVVGSYGSTATPFSRTVIVGSSNSINAPTPQTIGTQTYQFVSWSDSGAQTHEVVATAATTYIATFKDVTPPTISSVRASGLTATAATVSWTTDELADSRVEYGPTTAYGSSTTLDPTLLTSHSMRLTGLAAGTTYHYRVISRDAAGNVSVSPDFTFSTKKR